MNTPFDAMKATKEELAGIADVLSALQQRERLAEEEMSKAERELNALRKLRGYAQMHQDILRQRLARLEAEAKV